MLHRRSKMILVFGRFRSVIPSGGAQVRKATFIYLSWCPEEGFIFFAQKITSGDSGT